MLLPKALIVLKFFRPCILSSVNVPLMMKKKQGYLVDSL